MLRSYKDVKPSNILINRPETDEGLGEITDAQLSDLEDAVPEDHPVARSGKTVGTLPYASPENLLRIPWTTSTDIWSFGASVSGTQCPDDSITKRERTNFKSYR